MGFFTNVAEFPLKVPGLFAKGAGATWKVTPKPLQNLFLAGTVAGIGTGLLTYDAIGGRRPRKKYNENDFMKPLPDTLLSPQDLIRETTLETGPAEGRARDEWVTRMRGNDQQRQVSQPRPEAAENAAEMGAPGTLAI